MREFKFRAWIKKEKLMVSVPQYNINSFYGWNDKKTIIMQYAGLKDKNDVEIYEGDIVKGNYLRGIGVVEWNKYFCKFDISHRVNISPSDEFEVIGNIYENKDLLES